MTNLRKRHQFPLFTSHLDFAHSLWRQLIRKGDIVIDATMGNGHDTTYLSHLLFPHEDSRLIAYDVDTHALINTKKKLIEEGFERELDMSSIHLVNECHSKVDRIKTFIKEERKISLIVYNLGYRPGSGEKEKTTMRETTLESIDKAMTLIAPGGVISITSYPGHPEGQKEKESIDKELTQALLHRPEWSLTNHSWMNKKLAPQLYLLQRAVDP